MWNINEMKETGKRNFKSNYWRCVLAAFLLMVLVGGTSVVTGTHNININGRPVDGAFLNSMTSEQLVFLAVAAFTVVSFALIIGFALKVFVFNQIEVGCYAFFRENTKNAPSDIGPMKQGFDIYRHSVVTMLLRDIYLILWTMLFVIPGIVKMYSYRMVPFILTDEPELTANEVITRSRNMMNGHKWHTFLLDLSFIGWYLLGVITLGLVNIFWTEPYRQSANAYLYLQLK